ncbi:MAG: CHAT domain-containing protein [Acidimicrobiales bacterium]|jgi:CHAT domain-containing protein/tetratricopeptide (TPR) repeat protein
MARSTANAPLDAAERALAAVADDPLWAEAAALEVLADRRVGAEAASVAHRTVGLVARESGRLSAARHRLRRAIAIAEAGKLDFRAAEARLSLVLALLQGGYPAAALAELDRAAEGAPRELRGQVLMQRALIHIRVGRFEEALDESRRALPLLRRGGDRLNEARLLSNRGVLHAYRGELARAETDLNKALQLYNLLESTVAAAQVLHNLGYVSALKGDVPGALRRYDDAASHFTARGLSAPALSIDRAELLLSARLLPEARDHIDSAVRTLEASGTSLDLAEARLLLSQIALAEGDLVVSTSAARAARRQFVRQGRSRWAALAKFVEAQSRWASGTGQDRVPAQAGALAEVLRVQQWVLPSLECLLTGARAALRKGDMDTVRSLVTGVDRRSASGSAALRVRSWYGVALGRLAAGNRVGALAALRSGLEVAEDHRASLGATELRVRTASAVSELADLGLGLAFESRHAVEVLRWSERWRAGSLSTPRATPPADERLAQLLSTLREIVARIERASSEGEDVWPLVAQQRSIEHEIRQRARSDEGDFSRAPRFPDPSALREALGERGLVEYIDHNGRLHAVTATRKHFKLSCLASSAEVAAELSMLQFALRRLVLGRSSRPSLQAAAALLERSCTRLGGLLVEPLDRDLDGRDLVVVPTGGLHALAWALLASLRGRAVTVSPSASLWYSRQCGDLLEPLSAAGDREVVLVSGPRVAHGAEEIRRIRAAFHPGARTLQGPAATVKAVLRAFERRGLAHVAAHGSFRADNPQFSSLALADGPLTVYDLEAMARPPAWIVLSACDTGRSQVHPGDELMGTSAALLSLGTRAIVASVAPVPDDGVIAVMLALHAELAQGHGLAKALATAQARALPETLLFGDLASGDGPAREALAAGAFVCLGAG